MLEPTFDKVFDPTPIKVPVDLLQFKKENNIKAPTKYALLLGGLYIDEGHDVVFEAKFDKMSVDLYQPKIKFITEVDGERQPEQSKTDGRRDYFILLNSNNFVQRISNKQISEYIPKDQQVRLSMLAVMAYIKQLYEWKERGVPNYLENTNGCILNNSHNDIDIDYILEWFDEETK